MAYVSEPKEVNASTTEVVMQYRIVSYRIVSSHLFRIKCSGSTVARFSEMCGVFLCLKRRNELELGREDNEGSS
jgi:hypothetical protein